MDGSRCWNKDLHAPWGLHHRLYPLSLSSPPTPRHLIIKMHYKARHSPTYQGKRVTIILSKAHYLIPELYSTTTTHCTSYSTPSCSWSLNLLWATFLHSKPIFYLNKKRDSSFPDFTKPHRMQQSSINVMSSSNRFLFIYHKASCIVIFNILTQIEAYYSIISSLLWSLFIKTFKRCILLLHEHYLLSAYFRKLSYAFSKRCPRSSLHRKSLAFLQQSCLPPFQIAKVSISLVAKCLQFPCLQCINEKSLHNGQLSNLSLNDFWHSIV